MSIATHCIPYDEECGICNPRRRRQQRSNINGQEETVSALWDFAREVIELGEDQSFTDNKRNCTNAQLAAVKKARERIMAGFGYRTIEIQ